LKYENSPLPESGREKRLLLCRPVFTSGELLPRAQKHQPESAPFRSFPWEQGMIFRNSGFCKVFYLKVFMKSLGNN
jgi:hypothetical protein